VLELMEKETLSKEDLARIFAPVAKRPPHNTYAGFGRRAPSDKPPVMTPSELHAVSSGRGPANRAAPGMPSPGPRPSPAPAPAQYGANGAGRPATTPDGHPAQPGHGQPPYGAGQFAGGPGTPPAYPAQPPYSDGQPHPGQPQPPYPGGQSSYGSEESRSGGDNGQTGGHGQGWTPGDGQPGSR
jgi:cell division protease FtsH